MLDPGISVRRDPMTPHVMESAAPVPPCPNCGSEQVRAWCAECGERQPSHVDTTLRHLAREAYEEFVNVDGRLWRSIVALLSRPGLLAKEYFAGRRSRYMRPFSLFVLLNLLLFVAQPYTGLLRYSYAEYVGSDGFARMAEQRRGEMQMTASAFETRFDDVLQDQKKSMLLVAIPVFALALLVLFAGSGRTFAEHLVFAVHAYAFLVFYVLACATVLPAVVIRLGLLLHLPRAVLLAYTREAGLIATLGIGMIVYLAFGLRRFYHASWPGAIARACALFAVQGLLIWTFKTLLFHTVIHSV